MRGHLSQAMNLMAAWYQWHHSVIQILVLDWSSGLAGPRLGTLFPALSFGVRFTVPRRLLDAPVLDTTYPSQMDGGLCSVCYHECNEGGMAHHRPTQPPVSDALVLSFASQDESSGMPNTAAFYSAEHTSSITPEALSVSAVARLRGRSGRHVMGSLRSAPSGGFAYSAGAIVARRSMFMMRTFTLARHSGPGDGSQHTD